MSNNVYQTGQQDDLKNRCFFINRAFREKRMMENPFEIKRLKDKFCFINRLLDQKK